MKLAVIQICLGLSLAVSGCSNAAAVSVSGTPFASPAAAAATVPSPAKTPEPAASTAVTAKEQVYGTETAARQPSPSPAQTLDKPIICIEAGHQSKGDSSKEPIAPGSKTKKPKVMSGTQGIQTKKPEYKLTLEVALKLEKALQKNYKVVMIRRTNDVNISNSERAIICNTAKADLMIRLHADGSDNHSVKGMSFLYPSPESKYTKAIAPESLKLMKVISKYILQETGAKSNGLKPRDDLTGFNWLTVPSILIEMGFMTNKEEDVLMSTESYQNKIVKGITAGLDSYYADYRRTQ